MAKRARAANAQGRRRLTLLAGLAAWSALVPLVAPALGLELDVARKLEIADHVVPGIVALAAALANLSLTRGSPDLLPLVAVGLVFLAGVWMTVTHLPLLFQAGQGQAPWDVALFHSVPGVALLSLALVELLVEALREEVPKKHSAS